MAKILCSGDLSDYWDILDTLGKQGRIFIPEEVKNEIVVSEKLEKTEDDLSKWLIKRSSIPSYINIPESDNQLMAEANHKPITHASNYLLTVLREDHLLTLG